MRTILVLSLSLSLSGCGWFDRHVIANISGYSRECIDGVAYLQFPSGVTVAYDKTGKVVACK